MSGPGGRRSPAATHLTAFAAAVLVPALLIAIGFAALTLFGGRFPDPLFALLGTLSAFALSAAVIAAAALVLGLPLTWVLASNRMESEWAYPLAGFLAGAFVPFIIRALLAPGGIALGAFLFLAAAGGLPGALCGWLWWKLARAKMQPSDREAGR